MSITQKFNFLCIFYIKTFITIVYHNKIIPRAVIFKKFNHIIYIIYFFVTKFVEGVTFEATFAGCRAENERKISRFLRDGSKDMPRKNFVTHYFIYPFSTNNSAVRIPPPAAPRMVLCDKATHFQPSTESSLIRPTLIPMPLYKSLSSFVCGRFSSSKYVRNGSGADGKSSPVNGFL